MQWYCVDLMYCCLFKHWNKLYICLIFRFCCYWKVVFVWHSTCYSFPLREWWQCDIWIVGMMTWHMRETWSGMWSWEKRKHLLIGTGTLRRTAWAGGVPGLVWLWLPLVRPFLEKQQRLQQGWEHVHLVLRKESASKMFWNGGVDFKSIWSAGLYCYILSNCIAHHYLCYL